MRRNAFILASAALAASFTLTVSAKADGLDIRGLRNDYGVAILSPVDTGPPHDEPLWGRCRNGNAVFTPYYSPLTPISVRWRTCNRRCDIYTHYYPGYLRAPRTQLFVSGDRSRTAGALGSLRPCGGMP